MLPVLVSRWPLFIPEVLKIVFRGRRLFYLSNDREFRMLYKVAMTLQKCLFIFTATTIVMEVRGEIEWEFKFAKTFCILKRTLFSWLYMTF